MNEKRNGQSNNTVDVADEKYIKFSSPNGGGLPLATPQLGIACYLSPLAIPFTSE